jgi:hypothetical protein
MSEGLVFNGLTNDAFTHVLAWLGYRDACTLGGTCKQLREIMLTDSTWRIVIGENHTRMRIGGDGVLASLKTVAEAWRERKRADEVCERDRPASIVRLDDFMKMTKYARLIHDNGERKEVLDKWAIAATKQIGKTEYAHVSVAQLKQAIKQTGTNETITYIVDGCAFSVWTCVHTLTLIDRTSVLPGLYVKSATAFIVLDEPAKIAERTEWTWCAVSMDRWGANGIDSRWVNTVAVNLGLAGGSYALAVRPGRSPAFSLLPRDRRMHDLAMDLFGEV